MDTMTIQCIIERKGGTEVTLGKTDYHFKPNDAGHHVADVDDPKHLARFLQIPESFRIYDPDGEISDEEVQEEIDNLNDALEAEIPLDVMNLDQARARFEKVMGRPANPRSKLKTIIKVLQDEEAKGASGEDGGDGDGAQTTDPAATSTEPTPPVEQPEPGVETTTQADAQPEPQPAPQTIGAPE